MGDNQALAVAHQPRADQLVEHPGIGAVQTSGSGQGGQVAVAVGTQQDQQVPPRWGQPLES